MSLKPTQIYTFVVPANGPYRLTVAGEYFKILAATGAVDVTADWGRLNALTAGQGLEDSPFKFLFFDDKSGANNTVKVLVGDRKFIDGSSGSVIVASNKVAQSPNFANTQKTVTNASAVLAAANANRQYLLVQNKDLTGNIFVCFGLAATTAKGVRVPAGGNLELPGIVPTGDVYAIGDIASNANIVVVEG